MAERKASRRKLPKFPIGDMRDRIILLRRTTVPPQWGQPENTTTLVTIATVWAEVQTKMLASQGSGDKIYNGVDLQGKPAYYFTIRYRDDVDAFDTVIEWRDKYYQISSTESPEERNEYLTLVSLLKGADDLGSTQ